MKRIYKIGFILAVICAGLIAAFQIEPLPQDPAYHHFVDQRALHGVTNFWNVMSNMPFILFGLIGLHASSKSRSYSDLSKLQTMYTLFFTGAIFVGLGSSYYHLNPSNETLVWDRLPMTVAFMALFSIIVAEYISLAIGRFIFLPMLTLGMITVLYWYQTEHLGAGDLRPYAVVQFLPMILLPVILVLFNKPRLPSGYIWLLLLAYVGSKLSEHFDAEVYELTNELSGHSLKHLLASLGVFCLYLYYKKRAISTND